MLNALLTACAAGPQGLACQAGVGLAAATSGPGPGAGGSAAVTAAATASSSGASSGLLSVIADPMASAAEGLLKTLGTFWMSVGTPGLTGAGTPVATITGDTRWIVNLVAVGCILVAAARLAIRRRGEPARVMLTGLVRLVFVTTAATVIVQAAGYLGDQWSASLLASAHMGTGGWDTAINVTVLGGAFGGGDGVLLIVALLIIFSSLIQLMLMVLRVGLLIVLTGTLPLAAAASMCEWGESWWRKHVGWLVAWLLYKPAAALMFASALALTNGKSLTEVLSGWMLLILSILVLPALLRLVVPLTAALGTASSGSLVMAGAGAAATGAARMGGIPGIAAAAAARFRPSGSSTPPGSQDTAEDNAGNAGTPSEGVSTGNPSGSTSATAAPAARPLLRPAAGSGPASSPTGASQAGGPSGAGRAGATTGAASAVAGSVPGGPEGSPGAYGAAGPLAGGGASGVPGAGTVSAGMAGGPAGSVAGAPGGGQPADAGRWGGTRPATRPDAGSWPGYSTGGGIPGPTGAADAGSDGPASSGGNRNER